MEPMEKSSPDGSTRTPSTSDPSCACRRDRFSLRIVAVAKHIAYRTPPCPHSQSCTLGTLSSHSSFRQKLLSRPRNYNRLFGLVGVLLRLGSVCRWLRRILRRLVALIRRRVTGRVTGS